MPSGLFCLNSLNRFIFYIRSVFLLPCFIENIPVLKANSVDPDQTSLIAASDLVLHCLPMPLLKDARLKWVKTRYLSPRFSDGDIVKAPVRPSVTLYPPKPLDGIYLNLPHDFPMW